MIYWENDYFKADAEQCYKEILSLNSVTPKNILEYARKPDSELHKCFCWDDHEAAEKYRLQQARKVIRFLVVNKKEKEDYNDSIPHDKKITIMHHEEKPKHIVFHYQKKDEYLKALDDAKQELIRFCNKYDYISELKNVIINIKEWLKEDA